MNFGAFLAATLGLCKVQLWGFASWNYELLGYFLFNVVVD